MNRVLDKHIYAEFLTFHTKISQDDDVSEAYFGSSFPIKKKAVLSKVVVKMLDMYCLGFYFEKEDGATQLYWSLYSSLEKGG